MYSVSKGGGGAQVTGGGATRDRGRATRDRGGASRNWGGASRNRGGASRDKGGATRDSQTSIIWLWDNLDSFYMNLPTDYTNCICKCTSGV